MAKIDDIDKKILAFLHEDAFLSNKEMAQRLGMSATPIHERIKRMEKEGWKVVDQFIKDLKTTVVFER